MPPDARAALPPALPQVRFNLDYLALTTTPGQVEAFREAVRGKVAAEYGVAASQVGSRGRGRQGRGGAPGKAFAGLLPVVMSAAGADCSKAPVRYLMGRSEATRGRTSPDFLLLPAAGQRVQHVPGQRL